MPYLASSFPVTRVSSQKMRSAAFNTANARKVISPRLPIGVATRYSPGASSDWGEADADIGPVAASEAGGSLWLGLLVSGRQLGCRFASSLLSEPALAAPVAFAV